MTKNYDDKSETPCTLGEVVGCGVLMMTQHVGTAKSADGEYVLGTTIGGAPIIESATTGKRYVFSWHKLIEFAIRDGGIDG